MKDLIDPPPADASGVNPRAIERNAFGFDAMVKAAWAAVEEPRVLGYDLGHVNVSAQSRTLSERRLGLLRLIEQKFPQNQ